MYELLSAISNVLRGRSSRPAVLCFIGRIIIISSALVDSLPCSRRRFGAPRIFRMSTRNDPFPISFLIFILVILCISVMAKSDCNNVESKSPMLRLKRYLLCEYDSTVRPVQNNNNVTNVMFGLNPNFIEYVSIFARVL